MVLTLLNILGKRKKADLSPEKEKNPSKKTRSSSGLGEEENHAPAAVDEADDGKRRRSRRR